MAAGCRCTTLGTDALLALLSAQSTEVVCLFKWAEYADLHASRIQPDGIGSEQGTLLETMLLPERRRRIGPCVGNLALSGVVARK